MPDFTKLEKNLNLKFTDKDLLTQAFVHRSYLNENPSFKTHHNERLEFLGDAVLEHVITEYLFKQYPEKTEGELTTLRAALVNAKMLSKVAADLEFNDYLLLSQGEAKEQGKARQYILANSFEAFMGALYLDQGLDVCREFSQTHLTKELKNIIEKELYRDAKSRFQEAAQEKDGITPTYDVLEETGPDHEKKFVVGVFLGKELAAKGEGFSKQEAEEMAAREALEAKKW